METPHGKKTIAVITPVIPEVNAIRMELEKFCEAIRNNIQPVVSEVDGYRAMDIAHQILQKIKHNTINT
jgi:predicted dehydrogenase